MYTVSFDHICLLSPNSSQIYFLSPSTLCPSPCSYVGQFGLHKYSWMYDLPLDHGWFIGGYTLRENPSFSAANNCQQLLSQGWDCGDQLAPLCWDSVWLGLLKIFLMLSQLLWIHVCKHVAFNALLLQRQQWDCLIDPAAQQSVSGEEKCQPPLNTPNSDLTWWIEREISLAPSIEQEKLPLPGHTALPPGPVTKSMVGWL